MREFIEHLLAHGGYAANDINAEEIADILWLSAQLPQPVDEDARQSEGSKTDTGRDRQEHNTGPGKRPDDSGEQTPPPQSTDEKRADAYLPGSQREDGNGPGIASLPFSSPRVTSLPQRLALGRALRSLKRTAPSPTRFVLDEAATVQRIADERNWLPVMRPARERWLELVLLADESPSMTVWYELVGELQDLLEQSGAFRTVQRWGFYADPEQAAQVRFYAGSRFWEGTARYRSPAELNDPRGRRLILLVSDCVSAAWRQPGLNAFLADWKDIPATLVQVLPERLWGRTGLRLGREAALRARQPGQPNANLLVQPRRRLDGDQLPAGFPLPVVTLEPETLTLWSKGLTAKGSAWMLGVLFPRRSGPPPAPAQPAGQRPNPDAQRILDAFHKTASEDAQRLARYLSAVPLNLPVMRLVQEVMFDEPRQSHLAEVLLSGLLQRRPGQEREAHPDQVEYDFIDGARDLLRRAAGERELLFVLSRTSAFVDANSGLPIDFPTLLADPSRVGSLRVDEKTRPFAFVAADTLRQFGRTYTTLADRLEQRAVDNQKEIAKSVSSPESRSSGISVEGPVAEEMASSQLSVTFDKPELSYARVLILEDDPIWNETLTHVCEAGGALVFSASTTTHAVGLIRSRYINIVIVNRSLELGNPQNRDGIAFLEMIHTEGLGEVIQSIVVSGYPDIAQVRQAFVDYYVVDFLEKSNFRAESLRDALNKGLTRMGLVGPLEIEIEGNLKLADLLLRHQWAKREDMQELVVEFRDMLRRLFPKAEHLFIRPLPADQSGAGVLEIEPTFSDGVGAACIVKFGKKEKIQQESHNVRSYVENFFGTQSNTQVSTIGQRTIAAIRYQLVGTSTYRVVDFGNYYLRHSVEEITEGVLRNLLRVTCGLWYDNRTPHRRRIDLIEFYSNALSIEWQVVRDAVESIVGVHKENGTIAFSVVGKRYLDPLVWLERTSHYYVNGWQSITHGNLNQYNILISQDQQCWLIDFYRTGPGHILRDLVELEAVIKISLTHLPDLENHRRLEQILLDHPDIDKMALPPASDPLYKSLAVIAYLRRFSANLTGRDQDMREYNVALLMQLFKMLSLDFLRSEHEKILLSAAMLCSWLDNGGK